MSDVIRLAGCTIQRPKTGRWIAEAWEHIGNEAHFKRFAYDTWEELQAATGPWGGSNTCIHIYQEQSAVVTLLPTNDAIHSFMLGVATHVR